MKKQKDINPYIEILRILAIFALVLYHVSCMGERSGKLEELFLYIADRGWMGTDIFLVIAGYFFYNSYSQSCKGSSALFLKKRFFRIVPSYYLFIILYLTLGLLIERKIGNSFSLPKGYWLYFLTFTANIPMAFGSWSGVALEGLFAVSLLVQIYLIFIIVFSLIKSEKKRFFALLVIEIGILAIRFIPLLKNTEWFSYFFTLTRMDGFLFGMLLAILYQNEKYKLLLIKQKTNILVLSGLFLFMTAPFTGMFSVAHKNTSCLVFPLAGLFFAALLNHILTWEVKMPVFYAGDFVFSIYLAKLPLIYIVLRILDFLPGRLNFPFLFTLASLVLCIVWGTGLNIMHKKRRIIMNRINSLNIASGMEY